MPIATAVGAGSRSAWPLWTARWRSRLPTRARDSIPMGWRGATDIWAWRACASEWRARAGASSWSLPPARARDCERAYHCTSRTRCMTDPIRVALVDDHPLFREGVAHTLTAPEFEVVGE